MKGQFYFLPRIQDIAPSRPFTYQPRFQLDSVLHGLVFSSLYKDVLLANSFETIGPAGPGLFVQTFMAGILQLAHKTDAVSILRMA